MVVTLQSTVLLATLVYDITLTIDESKWLQLTDSDHKLVVEFAASCFFLTCLTLERLSSPKYVILMRCDRFLCSYVPRTPSVKLVGHGANQVRTMVLCMCQYVLRACI